MFVQKAKALIPHTDYGESQLIAMSNGEHYSRAWEAFFSNTTLPLKLLTAAAI